MSKRSRNVEVTQADRMRIVSIGMDLGDRNATFCGIDADGSVVERGRVAMRKPVVEQWAGQYPQGTLIAIEAGGHSPWVSRALASAGSEVLIANPRKIPLITRNKRKSDDIDPELLARLARTDRTLLSPITHRDEETQKDLQLIRTREVSVTSRTKLIGHIRGTVKAYGLRIPSCSTEMFVRKARESLDLSTLEPLEPILKIIDQLTATIRQYDREVETLAETKYPATKILMQIKGVGALTALAYVLVFQSSERFESSRMAGAYIGLVPARDQSGKADPQLGVTKAGDRLMRRLLIQSAHYILGPFGVDSDLRRHGERIASRGGKKAKKTAAVAVARKLAVLMHRLWSTGEDYDPLFNTKQQIESTLAASLPGAPVTAASSLGLSH
jgi:transposase